MISGSGGGAGSTRPAAGSLAVVLLLLAAPCEPANAGSDFNGDGKDDIAIGAHREALGASGVDEGTVHVVFGTRRKLPAKGSIEVNKAKPWLSQAGPRTGELFGTELGGGDFNGDGYDDLVVGAFFEAVGEEPDRAVDAGAVYVIYGGRKGLRKRKTQHFNQGDLGRGEKPEGSDRFGSAVVAGDFDRDGRDDLAVAAVGEDLTDDPETNSAGVVHVIKGGRRGLRLRRSRTITPISRGIEGGVGGEALGAELASGDFNADGRDDLVIGSRGDEGAVNAGAVHVVRASRRKGIVTRPRLIRHLSLAHSRVIGPGPEDEAGFGSALAADDFDDDGRDDLAVGSPGVDGGELPWVGAVRVFRGSHRGVSLRGQRYFTPEGPKIAPGEPRSGRWGSALAAGDLDADGRADLAVGTSFGWQGEACVGGVHVLFGSGRGIRAFGNQALTQEGDGIRGDGELGECDLFGSSLAIANLNGRGAEELVIGEPQEFRNSGFEFGVGGAHLLYPNRSRDFTARGYRFLTQDTPGVTSDGAEPRDGFGRSLFGG